MSQWVIFETVPKIRADFYADDTHISINFHEGSASNPHHSSTFTGSCKTNTSELSAHQTLVLQCLHDKIGVYRKRPGI